jgi:hypothetical protein
MPEVVQGARRAVTLYARRRRGRVVNAKRAEWTSWPWRHSKPAARGARRRRAPGALWLHGDGGAGRAQLMAAAAAERAKLAVHCHAGLGRTGWAPLAAARRQGCRPNVCSLCGAHLTSPGPCWPSALRPCAQSASQPSVAARHDAPADARAPQATVWVRYIWYLPCTCAPQARHCVLPGVHGRPRRRDGRHRAGQAPAAGRAADAAAGAFCGRVCVLCAAPAVRAEPRLILLLSLKLHHRPARGEHAWADVAARSACGVCAVAVCALSVWVLQLCLANRSPCEWHISLHTTA